MTDVSDLADRLGQYVTPITTAKPRSDRSDLQPLVDRLENARIVGLGEATHGTREFFQLKHRLLELLVEDLDCRVLAIEANFSEAFAIDEYIVHGRGSAGDALDEVGFWTWNTEEVLAMLESLRSFNRGRPPEQCVRCFGYDAQFAEGAAESVRAYLGRVDPEYRSEIESSLEPLTQGPLKGGRPPGEQLLHESGRLVDELADRFDQHRSRYVESTSQAEWELARQHLRTLSNAVALARELHQSGDLQTANARRDETMAATVRWIRSYTDAERMALWGHNEHVFEGGSGGLTDQHRPMGGHLAAELGEEYYALGFGFDHGSFQARSSNGSGTPGGLTEWTVEPVHERWPPEGLDPQRDDWLDTALGTPALTAVLSGLDASIAFVDIRAAANDPELGPWLSQPHHLYSIGSVFFDGSDAHRAVRAYRLPEELDGFLFVETTDRAVAL